MIWGSYYGDLKLSDPALYDKLFGANGDKQLSWTSELLLNAVKTWNEKLTEIWRMITTSPKDFKDGVIWDLMDKINGVLQAIGMALLVLFFVVGVVKVCGSFTDVKKPEHAFKLFIRFALAKGAVTYGMELLTGLFTFSQGIVAEIINGPLATSANKRMEVPPNVIEAIEKVSAWKFWEQIPLWLVCLLGGIGVTIIAYLVLMTVYMRFIKLYMHVALAPIPLSSFAGEPSQNMGKSFLKSYVAVCLEVVVMVLAIAIFSRIASTPSLVDSDASPIMQAWGYIGETIFNMFVLLGTMKISDRVIKEMMGL